MLRVDVALRYYYCDLQNYRERGHYNNRNRRDSYRSRDEEEPEWFTEGPTSQHERIELHGFEKRGTTTPDKEDERLRQAEQDANKQEVKKMVSHKEVEEEEVSHSRESGKELRPRDTDKMLQGRIADLNYYSPASVDHIFV